MIIKINFNQDCDFRRGLFNSKIGIKLSINFSYI